MMNMEAPPPGIPGESPFRSEQRAIPLVALFLLTAIVAVLLAVLAIALRSFDFWSDDWVKRLVAAMVTGLILSIFGGISGLFSHQRLLGVSYGATTGAIVGIMGAAILYASSEDRSELTSVACLGSLVVILLAAAIRWQASRSD